MRSQFGNFIDRVFCGDYVHSGVNILQRVMYRGAFPFAVLLNRMGMSPNRITTASLAFAILAFCALAFAEGWIWYCIFWGMSILLDFSDGTVARMTGRISKSAFRYDHMSDLFKVSLLMLGVGIRYDDSLVWVLALSACFTFLYRDALNRELSRTRERQAVGSEDASSTAATRRRDRYAVVAWAVRYQWALGLYKNLVAILFTVSGHTLLLFFLFPLGSEPAIGALIYLILVESLAIRSRIARLVVMRR